MNSSLWKFFPFFAAIVFMIAIAGFFVYLRIHSRNFPTPASESTDQLSLIPPTGTFLFPKGLEIGTWVWKSPVSVTDDEWRTWLSFCKKEAIGTLYFDISSVADIEEVHDPQVRLQKEKVLSGRLKTLIGEATRQGISVQGLAGNPIWANADYAYISGKIVSFVVAYNKTSTPDTRLAGMQFDIESYQQPAFDSEKNRTKILGGFLRLVAQLTEMVRTDAPELRFGFTLPYWFDGESTKAPAVIWNNRSQFPAFHVFDILASLQHAYVVILDYRTEVSGNNGSIAHVFDELAYTREHTPGVHIFIGQETTSVEPRSITFFGHSRHELKGAIHQLTKNFADNPTLAGFAIHQLESYIKMKE